jgi:hypothetical protein
LSPDAAVIYVIVFDYALRVICNGNLQMKQKCSKAIYYIVTKDIKIMSPGQIDIYAGR